MSRFSSNISIRFRLVRIGVFCDNKSVGNIKGIKKTTYVVGMYLYGLGTKIQLLH